MGEPELADLALIPETVSLSDPAYRMQRGWLDYAADSELINDNLLDLSHLSFVHENTLGVGTPQWADERPRITRLERGLRVQRWIENKVPPRQLRQYGELLDMWNAYDFVVPGIFILRSLWYPAGTAKRVGHAVPNEEPLFLRVDDQAVTAMTDRSARYFYAAGARRTCRGTRWSGCSSRPSRRSTRTR
jgi:phenylpropionate dioxygenase-like ring-hydroxylating dioxygenase large terminal subunit